MKKYNILNISVFLVVCIFAFSCKKSNNLPQNQKTNNSSQTPSNHSTKDYIVDPSNNLNDLDFVGQLHNECLDIQANVLIDAMQTGISQTDAKQLIKVLTAKKLNSYFKTSIGADDLTFTDNFKDCSLHKKIAHY